MQEQALPEWYFWKALARSPVRCIGFWVLCILYSVALGLASCVLGHLCLRRDDSYVEDPEHHFTMRQVLYVGDVGGLIACPLQALSPSLRHDSDLSSAGSFSGSLA
jgi:hypothetical protein